MNDEHYHREDRDRARSARYASHYDMLQPRFTQVARPVPPRHRYRATQYHDPMYDVVEDEEMYEHGERFDAFGKILIYWVGERATY